MCCRLQHFCHLPFNVTSFDKITSLTVYNTELNLVLPRHI